LKAAFVLVALAALAFGVWRGGFGAAASRILIEDAVAQPMPDGTLGAFLSIDNQGAPDRLLSVSSPVAEASLYRPAAQDSLPIATGHSALALDAAHVQISQPETPFDHGSLVPLTLVFANAGAVAVKARMSDPAKAGSAAEVGLFGLGDICIVGEGEPAPAITLNVIPQGDGWRVLIDADDFTFSKDLMGLYHVPGTGHGHIYVGGMKLGRLFAPEYDIGPLPQGTHEIRVTLNTNDHRAYVVDKTPVTATAIITVD
jgi:copper(I)-binding protein